MNEGQVIKPKALSPTRRLSAEFRCYRQSLFGRLHGYAYLRWLHFYTRLALTLFPLVEALDRGLVRLWPARGLRRLIAASQHGKVVPLAAATQLVTVNEEISLTNLEQVVPFSRARDIILHNPDHIVAFACACRAARKNPCLPLDVCLIIGEPFASFILEHQPDKSRRIAPQEAVAILQAEDERGHVHHAFFKDALLNRFYAICNCCACCCGAMQFWRHGAPMLIPSGYVSQVNADLCIGCGACVSFCQFQALSLSGGRAVVDESVCLGCGVCVSKCKQEAISLLRDPRKGEPLEIHRLVSNT